MRHATWARVFATAVVCVGCSASSAPARNASVGASDSGRGGAAGSASLTDDHWVDAGLGRTGTSVVPAADGGKDAPSKSGDASPSGARPPAAAADHDAICQGAAIAIPTGAGETLCPGALASQSFRYSLCTCRDAMILGALTTDAFDSGAGAMSMMGGGSVGTNGGFTGGGLLQVGGSVTVAGPAGWSLPGDSSAPIRGDLRVAGPLDTAGTSEVSRDVWLGGALTGSGALVVHGALHQTPGAARSVARLDASGGDTREPVQVAAPCSCAPEDLLDVPGIVAAAKLDNHNAEAKFDPNSLANVTVPTTLELPCGRLYASEISIGAVGASLTIKAQGKTALFVDGDVKAGGLISIELGPDADLDVFVRGNLVIGGIQSAGDTMRPAHLRLYVGGSDGILLAGITTFTGNIYAPRATVTTAGLQELYGAIFAGDFVASGATTIHYDRAVVRTGDDCTPPPQCKACGDCAATSACVDGRCGACRTDSDCCQPLTCVQGECAPILL